MFNWLDDLQWVPVNDNEPTVIDCSKEDCGLFDIDGGESLIPNGWGSGSLFGLAQVD